MQKASVDVIIPTYNGLSRGFLTKALDALRAQTVQPQRIIMVDDGSKDDTAVYVRTNYPEVEVHTQPNGGPSAARNTALALADSEFIAFLDDDDVWAPDKLARQLEFLKQHPDVDLVFCGMQLIDRTGQVIGQKLPAQFGHTFPESALGNSFLPPSTLLLRRSLAQKVGPFDLALRLGEDYEWSIRCSMHGRVATMPETLVGYRVHDASSCPDYKLMERANLRVIDSIAKAHAPREAERIRQYYCYGSLCRGLLKRDWAFAGEMRRELGARFDVVKLGLRMIGIALSGYAPLKNKWRNMEYRAALGPSENRS